MTDELDTSAAVASYLGQAQQTPAQDTRISMTLASSSKPDYEAELRKVARKTGVPVDSARAFPEEIKAQASAGTMDYEALAQQFPRTAGFLSGVENAQLAHDDAENMGSMEALFNSFARGVPALKSVGPSVDVVNSASNLGVYRKIDERIASGEDAKAVLKEYGDYGLAPLPWHDSEQALASWNKTKARAMPTMQDRVAQAAGALAGLQGERNKIPLPAVIDRVMQADTFGDAMSQIASDPLKFLAGIGPESLVQSAPGLIAAIPASFAGGPVGAGAALGANSALVDYAGSIVEAMGRAGVDTSNPESIRAATSNPELLASIIDQASKHAAVVGSVDALSGGLAGKVLLPTQTLAGKPLARALANVAVQLPLQAGLGAAGEAGGQVAAGQEIRPGEILAEAFGEFFGTPAEVVSTSAKRLFERRAEAQRAEQTAEQLAQLDELAKASKVRARDATTFEAFVREATADGPVQDVYIAAAQLAQSGFIEQIAEASPSAAAQYADALATGGDVRIPVAEYTARIAGTDFSQSLLDHLKTEPQGMSRAEAQEYMQTQGDQLRADVEQVLNERKNDQAFKESADKVRENIRAQLDQADRFNGPVNESYAALVSNFYAVMGAKLNIDPQALYAQYPLKVAAETVSSGGVLEQGSARFSEDNRLSNLNPQGASWQRIRESNPALAGVTDPDQEVTVYRATVGDSIRPDDFVAVDKKIAQTELKNVKARDGKGKIIEQKVKVRDLLMANDATEFVYFPEAQTLNQSAQALPDTINVNGKERPTTNSNGQPIATTEEAVRNFWEWFGDSKVVDAEGRPLVVYHGTGGDFTEFDGRSKYGGGTYFSSDPRIANGRASVAAKRDNGAANVVASYLRIANSAPYAMPADQAIAKGYDGILRGREYIAFNSEQIKSATGNTGTFNPNDPSILAQGARGSFSPSTNTITLLKNADLSTFLHESGHFFLETMLDIAARPDAPAAITDDAQALFKWFGVADLAAWQALDFEGKREFHEQFARGFEAYLFEGKAPSIELQGLFQRFRAWLVNVYKDIRALDVQLTDEVRGVMDRMIASTEEIKLAEQGRSMLPFFETAEQAGMTPEEFAAYQTLGTDATNDAIQELQARGLRDMQWLHNARGREIKRLQKERAAQRAEVRALVEAEVNARPIYRADRFLRFGELEIPEGANKTVRNIAQQANVEGTKLSLPALKEMYGEEANAIWRFLPVGKRGLAAAEGMHPDIVAELFGFASGDQLVRDLLAANPRKQEIEEVTDARLLEQYSELATPEDIARAADKAIHNAARSRFVTAQANALAKAVGGRRVLASAAKEYAAQLIARLKVKDVKPHQYAAAEARAAKNTQKALKADDIATAATEARSQMINNYATRAAYETRDEITKIDRFFKKIVTAKDDATGKTRDMDIVNAARAVLGNFGYGGKAKTAAEYLKAVQAYDPALYEVLKTSVESAEAVARPSIQELTVEQLRGLHAEIESLWYLAKRTRQMEIDGDLMDRQEAAAELGARLEEIGIPDVAPGENSAVTPEEELAMNLATVRAALRRVESWVDAKDGSNKFGSFRKILFTPIKEAADRYRASKVPALRKFRESVAAIAPTLKPGLISAPEFGYTFGKDSGSIALNEILHALIHTGNTSNKRKLLLGRAWGDQLPDGSLDTVKWDAFINRLVAEGTLKVEHFDFVQSVWDQLEELKPLAQKAHRDAYGKYFAEVTAESFVDPFGVTRRGGYAPAQVDSRIVKDNELKKLIEEGKEGMAYAFPGSNKGFTNSRVEYNKPLLLDLRTLPQHIDKVLMFSHMEMPVRDAAKLIASKAVSTPLNRVDPAAINGMLMPWLNRAARQQVATPIAGAAWMMRLMNTIRTRTSMATMMANVSNTAQQITGFALAGLKVKPTELLSSTAAYMRAPKKTAERVAELSPYMANRMSNEVAAMMGEIEGILINPSLLERGQEWTKRHTYFMQSAFDNVMGPIIWTAAYNQALAEDFNPKNAARIADSVIRQTQGSTLPEDISRVESGPAYARIFTQFAGYFNMQANLLGTEFSKLTQEMGLRKGMGRGLYIFIIGFFVPAMVAQGIAEAFRGGPPDDEKDGEYLDDWLMSLFVFGPMRNATAFVPFVGQAANSAIARFNNNPVDDRVSVAPAVGAIEGIAGVPIDLYKTAIGEGKDQRTVKDLATLISLTTGLPASVAARPVGYLAGVAQGKTEATSPVDAARGLITGVASPASKQQ